MLCWLAVRIQQLRQHSPDGRIDRRTLIQDFDAKFKKSGIELTPGTLAGIYARRGRTKSGATRRQGNQQSFVRKYLALNAQREAAEQEAAAPAAQPEQPVTSPAPAATTDAPQAKSRADRDMMDEWSEAPRIAPQQFTTEHVNAIALAFAEWVEDRHGFQSPSALAAARINAARAANRDPIANAYAIQDRIGDTLHLVPFLMAAPAFMRKFGAHAPIKAQLIKSAVPAFKDAA